MLRMIAVAMLLLPTAVLLADDEYASKLKAPEGWGGETISLPPGFARDMKLKGEEHIRFAPGMMKPDSDTFFCYAFVFELEREPKLTQEVVKEEFLKYYRGLCVAVLRDAAKDVEPAKFTLELQREKSDEASATTRYAGVLDWVEPFATKKPQKLHLEIWTWEKPDRNYIFACVSPQSPSAAIWKQLRAIRNEYVK